MSDRDEIDARMQRMGAALPRGPVRDLPMPPYKFQKEEFGSGSASAALPRFRSTPEELAQLAPIDLRDTMRDMTGRIWTMFERSVIDYLLAVKAKGMRLAITPVSLGEYEEDYGRPFGERHRFSIKADIRRHRPGERCPPGFAVIDYIDGRLQFVELGEGVKLLSEGSR